MSEERKSELREEVQLDVAWLNELESKRSRSQLQSSMMKSA